jgi:hypothetical protein
MLDSSDVLEARLAGAQSSQFSNRTVCSNQVKVKNTESQLQDRSGFFGTLSEGRMFVTVV